MENLVDFPSTVQILLEHNYRSTGAILEVSAAIIAQDASRIPKTLQTQHAPGPIPCLQSFSSSYGEADFIAQEIKKLVADTGGMLEWKDFVVLLRYNSLSRTIESALQKQGIPNRVLAGHKFFERAEVKDVLSYLQVIDNPQFIPAFSRAVNIPSRGIGDKSISEILSRAASLNKSPLEVVEGIYEGRMADIKPSVKRKLKSFVEPVQELRTLANDGESPSSLIRRLLELIHYQAHLKKTQPDADSRWDNVQELITFARESEANGSCNQVLTKHDGDQEWDDQREDFDHAAFEEDGIVEVAGTDDAPSEPETPLRLFLQASMLSTDVQTQDGQASNNKVTISTCHTAKGLEWPVVFLPAVETGTFPSARAEDVEEERRLLYVACTRAQGLLYFSYANSRMVSGETKDQEISEFLRAVRTTKARLFSDLPPQLTREDRALLATVLHRPVPDEAGVARRRDEYHTLVQQAQQTRWNNHGSTSSYTNQSSYPPSYNDTAPTLDPSSSFQPTFASVRTMQFSAGPSSTAPRVPLSPSRPSVLNTVPTQMVSSKPHSAGRKPVSSQAPAPRPVSRQAPLTSFLEPSSSTLQPPGQTIIPPVTKVSVPPLSSATSNAESQPTIIPPKTNGVKRRLGMGGGTSGYSNKKYKPPT
ncbi:hypothetical protein QCA50_007772 [Cerrena zonata]|uniref:UvrD-like helicase C-terminal domain-containing protein n=1 Tax=Cerrena zonata TaxID=2478898 RepID=A0AAW0G8L4_9APHY